MTRKPRGCRGTQESAAEAGAREEQGWGGASRSAVGCTAEAGGPRRILERRRGHADDTRRDVAGTAAGLGTWAGTGPVVAVAAAVDAVASSAALAVAASGVAAAAL